MIDDPPTASLVIRLATPEDIPLIQTLDSFSESPSRDIHRDVEKYFGSVDPSTHERTLIFLAEVGGVVAAKAELMLPPADTINAVGYIKRVVVHPQFRKRGLSHQLMQYIITFASIEAHLDALDLHVWEDNIPAIRLYESLGFEAQHREVYYHLSL
jgi:ribosomal protein S18 acetylase RimI-like enzyme